MVNLKKRRSNFGFSLIEVILAAVLFSLSVAGFYASLAAVRQPVEDNNMAVGAALYSQQILEGLRSGVGSDTWNAAAGPGSLGVGNYNVGNGTYAAAVVVSCITAGCPDLTEARVVTVTVTY